MYNIEGVKKVVREETLKEGIVIGEVRGERKILVDLICRKFGDIPAEVLSAIEQLTHEDILALCEKLYKVRTLKGLFGSKTHESKETTLRRSLRKRRREAIAL
jgi:hypothetical protein